MDFVQVGILLSGSIDLEVNLKQYHVGPGDMILLNYGATIVTEHVAEHTRIEGLGMSREFARQVFGPKLPELLRNPSLCVVARHTAAQQALFEDYLTTLVHLCQLGVDEGHETIRFLLASMFSYAEDMLTEVKVDRRGGWSRNKLLTEQFISLLHDHVREHHAIGHYAALLGVSPHYLIIVVKEETGRTPKSWIDMTLVQALQLELKYTDKGLRQLAQEFCFSSTSSLCKFYRRITGTTATEYRVGAADGE